MKTYNSSFRPLRSKDQSPSRNTPHCAWCAANGQPHAHATPDCAMLKNANALDQWKIIYGNRLCDRCLMPGHHWRECKTVNEICPSCDMKHHINLSCRPEETLSRFPNYVSKDESWPSSHSTGRTGFLEPKPPKTYRDDRDN